MKSYEELHAIVRDLEPILRKFAPMAEADCKIPKEAIDEIREAGLFRIWIPEKLGGWDVDPVTACRIFEDIARIDSAASWSVQMSNGVAALGRFFGDQAVAEIYAGGSKILADAFAPPGAAARSWPMPSPRRGRRSPSRAATASPGNFPSAAAAAMPIGSWRLAWSRTTASRAWSRGIR